MRVFFRRHQQADGLPTDPVPIPLLVFVHGLGGSVAQFNSLLTSLTQVASCLAVDLPGCGASEFAVKSWGAYTTDGLVELLETVIEDHRDVNRGQGVVLIGHSMGASLCALLARPRSKPSNLSKHVVGMVAICPKAEPPTERQEKLIRALIYIPGFLFDLYRAWDRRGGIDSPSVLRFAGPEADVETRRLQNLYNWQSRTPVFRRMAWGSLPERRNGALVGGLPSAKTWSNLDIPVFLVGGESDNVCDPADVKKIADLIDNAEANSRSDSVTSKQLQISSASSGSPIEDSVQLPRIPPLPLRPEKAVKMVVLPEPANHTLPYAPATAPILAGLISDFLVERVTGRLSQGWQLQYLSRDGKWDVKNLEKWMSVPPVSDPIGGVFRAIKTLREVDEVHCPRQFVANWGNTIKDVIDISHDNPVYDPHGLEEGGISYHKLPTVSKMPPNDVEIKGFIDLVDKIREGKKDVPGGEKTVIGVHCHYGFNRTGFLIVCYLVERCGFKPKNAIEHFAQARKPNGIKHSHFKDRLYLRYSGVKNES